MSTFPLRAQKLIKKCPADGMVNYVGMKLAGA